MPIPIQPSSDKSPAERIAQLEYEISRLKVDASKRSSNTSTHSTFFIYAAVILSILSLILSLFSLIRG
jgi:hypothetical protein